MYGIVKAGEQIILWRKRFIIYTNLSWHEQCLKKKRFFIIVFASSKQNPTNNQYMFI